MTGPDAPITIRRALPEHWEAHRDLRLEMLADAPDAFWTTIADVHDRAPEQWREDVDGSRIHLQALVGDEVAGGLGIDPVGYDEDVLLDDETVNIVSVYVRPAFRGGGIVRALMVAARDTVDGLGRKRMLLETVDDNAAARCRYQRLGFVETGRRFPDPRREDHQEIEYEARIESLCLD